MPNQHKTHPVSFRPGVEPGDPAGDRFWLEQHAQETDQPVGAVLSRALAEYRARHEAGTAGDRDQAERGAEGCM